MVSGTSRAWSNSSSTDIGATTIASLDDYTDNALDMALLMTTGVAQGKPDEDINDDIPDPPVITSNYYIHSSGNTTAWADNASFSLSSESTVTPQDSLPTSFKYYSNQTDATNNRDKKLILALGDSSREDGFVDLGGLQISNGVIVYSGGAALAPGDKGGSGYAPDNADAKPLTYSYGILELATNAFVKLGVLGNGNNPIDNITKGWSFIGSLQLKENSRLSLENRSLAVTGTPYTSLEKGARIDILKGAVLSFGASNESTWDAIVMQGINKGSGSIINTSNSSAELGTPSAGNVEFRDVLITTQGYSDITMAAKLGGVNVYANSTYGTSSTVTLTGGVADGHEKGIKQLRTGDQTSITKAKVNLHNRGESVTLDSLIIGRNHTVGARKEGAYSGVSTISIEAYNPSLESEDFSELWAANGLYSYRYSELEANLSLGIAEATQCVVFTPALSIVAYGKTDRTEGYGLNMLGNNVELVDNIVIYDYYTQPQETDSEILLFTNVNALTLHNTVYDERYFDYTAGIAASEFFATAASTPDFYGSFDDPTYENGSLTGWFVEYRANGQDDGTGDVYLTYRAPKLDSIPEPSSASLSLLALVAIAARRRRK